MYVLPACACVCERNVCGVSKRIEIATINKKVFPACLPSGNKQIEMTKFIVDFMCAHTYPDTHILRRAHTHRPTYIDIPIHWQAPLGINRPK